MDQAASRALKLVFLAVLSLLFVVGGLWFYLSSGLIVGLAGPFLAVSLLLYVGYDVYTTVVAA
jgi:hypothetical protein